MEPVCNQENKVVDVEEVVENFNSNYISNNVTGTITNTNTSSDLRRITLQNCIFNSSSYVKERIIISGMICLVDLSLKRMDISNNGAKLIIDISNVNVNNNNDDEDEGIHILDNELDINEYINQYVAVGNEIEIIGLLKRKSRKIYFEAKLINKNINQIQIQK